MTESNPTRISFELKGSREDATLVRAEDFVDWLDGVLACFKRLAQARESDVEAVYRVTHLALGSAVIELEATSESDGNVTADTIATDFVRGIDALRAGQLAATPFELETKRAFANLGRPLRRALREVKVTAGISSVSLDAERFESATISEAVEAVATGSYSGFIEALNVHARPVFYLYPVSGPSRIPCHFDQSLLLDTLRRALKRYTTVHGLMEYAPGSVFPSRIVVEHIEINPPDDELPTLRSLFGAAPQLTDGLDSVTFVRLQRDAEA